MPKLFYLAFLLVAYTPWTFATVQFLCLTPSEENIMSYSGSVRCGDGSGTLGKDQNQIICSEQSLCMALTSSAVSEIRSQFGKTPDDLSEMDKTNYLMNHEKHLADLICAGKLIDGVPQCPPVKECQGDVLFNPSPGHIVGPLGVTVITPLGKEGITK